MVGWLRVNHDGCVSSIIDPPARWEMSSTAGRRQKPPAGWGMLSTACRRKPPAWWDIAGHLRGEAVTPVWWGHLRLVFTGRWGDCIYIYIWCLLRVLIFKYIYIDLFCVHKYFTFPNPILSTFVPDQVMTRRRSSSSEESSEEEVKVDPEPESAPTPTAVLTPAAASPAVVVSPFDATAAPAPEHKKDDKKKEKADKKKDKEEKKETSKEKSSHSRRHRERTHSEEKKRGRSKEKKKRSRSKSVKDKKEKKSEGTMPPPEPSQPPKAQVWKDEGKGHGTGGKVGRVVTVEKITGSNALTVAPKWHATRRRWTNTVFSTKTV